MYFLAFIKNIAMGICRKDIVLLTACFSCLCKGIGGTEEWGQPQCLSLKVVEVMYLMQFLGNFFLPRCRWLVIFAFMKLMAFIVNNYIFFYG